MKFTPLGTMMQPIKVLLLYGGKSGEHEISLISAASVMANLDPIRYHIIPVGMDKEGCCYLNDYNELLGYPNALPVRTENARPLESLMVNGQLSVAADVVFPIVHGPLYEDGCLQGLLELTNVAYVGCGVLSSAIGMDKDIARRIASLNGVQSARYRMLSASAPLSQVKQFCEETVAELGWPLFIKPCVMGSSVGITKANNMAAFQEAIAVARRYDSEIIVEEYIQGREIELAVLENNVPHLPPLVSLPGEICVKHPDGFYSYTAKYLESEHTELLAPAPLDDALVRRLQNVAGTIFTTLKCKGMARVDLFLTEGKEGVKVYFNEINTLPGFTSISMYPRMWQVSGLSYPELLVKLISLAMEQHTRRQQLVRHYQ